MAKSKADGADAPDAKSAKSKKIKIVVLVVAALAAYKFVGPGKAKPTAAAPNAPHVVVEGEVMSLPDLTLNLADNEPRFLRVGVALILEKGTSMESMKNEAPIASDVVVDVLSSRTFDQLHQPGAKEEVKKELSTRVRKAFDDHKVARVIFTSFVMQ